MSRVIDLVAGTDRAGKLFLRRLPIRVLTAPIIFEQKKTVGNALFLLSRADRCRPYYLDLTGIEFADLAAAIADAEEGVREQSPDDFHSILITDAGGSLVATVRFAPPK